MKNLLYFIFFFSFSFIQAQNKYFSKDAKVHFFSDTKMEKIEGTNNKAVCVLDASTGALEMSLLVAGFKFEKALMEEHFNEKYLESDKYKDATFKGKIQELLVTDRDTTYQVTVNGTITIHGVENPANYKAEYRFKAGVPAIEGSFNVALKDHKVDIPKLVIQNIAEVVKVTCKFELVPYQKKN